MREQVKDVQYYENLVQREVADKTLSWWCYYLWCYLSEDDTLDIKYLKKMYFYDEYNKSYTPNDFDILLNEKWEEVWEVAFVDYKKEWLILAMETEDWWLRCVKKLLWHEIRPHHLLLRCEKHFIFCKFTTNIEDNEESKTLCIYYIDDEQLEHERVIDRDLTKPFSWQKDETKIELGKIVESVLLSKDDS